MEPASNSRKRQIITTLAVLIVIVAIVAAVTVSNKKNSEAETTSTDDTATTQSSDTSTQSTATTDTTGSSSTSSSSTYKDGTYTATGSYESPGGTESITVTVTLANNVITSTSAKSGANDSEAEEYQSQFIAAYKSLVVGKNISSVSLSRVSGSSLTSQGFNNAIDKIESQAKA